MRAAGLPTSPAPLPPRGKGAPQGREKAVCTRN